MNHPFVVFKIIPDVGSRISEVTLEELERGFERDRKAIAERNKRDWQFMNNIDKIDNIINDINVVNPSTQSTVIEDDPDAPKICTHREHNPPAHIVIPAGKRLRHKCPGCGKQIIIRSMQVSF